MKNEVIEVKDIPANEDSANVNSGKRKITKKAIIICLLAFIVCLLACLAVLLVVFKPNGYIQQEHLWALSEAEICCDETCVKTFSEESHASNSIDGKYALIMDGETLYVGSGEKKNCKQIATDVKIAAISASGNAICYVNSDHNLCLYKTKNNKTKVLDRDVDFEYLVISPKGKSVAYTKTEDDVTLYAWNGKAKKLDDDLTPVSITDDAKTIYARKLTNGAFYSYNLKGKHEKIADISDTSFLMNYYGNEIIYTSDGYAYISVDGKEGEKLFAADYISTIFPQDVIAENSFRYMEGILEISPYKTLKNMYFESSTDSKNTVCYVDEKFDGDVLISDAIRPILTANGKKIFYLNSVNELSEYSIKNGTSSIISSEIYDYDIDKNARYVYAINKEGKLVSIKGKKDIASNVDSVVVLGKNVFIQTGSDESFFGTLKKFKIGKNDIDTVKKNVSVLGKFGRYLLATDEENHYVFVR